MFMLVLTRERKESFVTKKCKRAVIDSFIATKTDIHVIMPIGTITNRAYFGLISLILWLHFC